MTDLLRHMPLELLGNRERLGIGFLKFPKRHVNVNSIDKMWAAALVDMQAFTKFNRGMKYILIVINIFSKYGWIMPLEDKRENAVSNALKRIFKEGKPNKMWVDKGKEFVMEMCKSYI